MRYLVAVFLLNISFLNSQSNYSFGIVNGLNLSSKDSYLGVSSTQVNPVENSYSLIKGSLAGGYSFGGTFSYFISPSLSFDFEITKFNGFNTLFSLYDLNNNYEKSTVQLKQFRITPSVSFILKQKKIDFFMSSGIIFPSSTSTRVQTEVLDNNLGVSRVIEETYRYNLTWGFRSKIGVVRSLGKHFNAKFDLGFNWLNMAVKSKKINSYEINNVEVVNSLDNYTLQTNYFPNLNNYNNNEKYNIDFVTSKPKDELQFNHNLSSLALSLTLCYLF